MIDFLKTLTLILVIIVILVIIFYFVFKLIIRKKRDIKILEEKKLIDSFNKLLSKVEEQSSDEILECLIEMESLDKIYEQITERQLGFLDELEYLKLKEDTLNEIIENKIKNIKPNRNKKDNLKSLKDEIITCKNRYPQYNRIFVKHINTIKKKITKNK